MELCHKNIGKESPAIEKLGQFIREWHLRWEQEVADFERFEHELHEQVQTVEREMLMEALARYDVNAEQIEVSGVTYQQALTSSETYLTASGLVAVERHLYRPAGRGSHTICPLELRAGIIGGYWTPRAARQAAFAMAHLTGLDSEALFDELEGMRPSRASLDRLPKELSTSWENHREAWEAAIREQEGLPSRATVLVHLGVNNRQVMHLAPCLDKST